MSEPTPIRADVPAEAEEAVTLDNGMLVIDLAGLPTGSTVTITVRVGPEAAPQPEAEPPAPKVKGHLGRGPING